MILQQIRTIRQKKEQMLQLETNIKVRNELITEFTEIISNLSEQFKQLTINSTKENCYLYSPYNNTKPLSSQEILNYAKKISHSLQAPKKYVPDSVLPANFVLPFPTEDNIYRSYAYYNSRTDGKAPQKCQMPQFGITNKIDIVTGDPKESKEFHMRQPAIVVITASEPKDCEIVYSMDGSIPHPFSEKRMTNGESMTVFESCTLKIMACKYGFLDSEILNLHFIIDRVDALRDPNQQKAGVNIEFAQRPDLMGDIKVTGGIEFLDTPYSIRTPSHAFTPSYTPSYYREPSIKEQGDH